MINKIQRMSGAKRRLMSNTFMLFVLTFSNYFLALVTLPYQTRILGAGIFGEVAFAMAFTTYFQIIIDFGFMLSATEAISRYRNDKTKVSEIFSSVIWSKIGLTLVVGIVFMTICLSLEPFKSNVLLYVLFFISSVLASFLPDYLYRGMENMRIVTIRSVGVRLFFALMVFIFLKEKADYYVIPLLGIAGNAVALLLVGLHIRLMGFSLKKIPVKDVLSTLKTSSLFFLSRVATNIYGATNVFVLGIVYGSTASTLGYFSSANRIVTAARGGISPIVDSMYPYMVHHKDYRLMKRALIVGVPTIGLVCVLTAIFAESITAFLFGEDFRGAGEYLRLLMPIVFVAFPSLLLGYPTLSPLGLAKYANLSTLFGAILQLVQIGILLITGNLTFVTICIATVITELAILSFRVVVILRNKQAIKSLMPGTGM